VIIQEQIDGLGNLHAPPPVFDGISEMLIYRENYNFMSNLAKFLPWPT
jgi:hypothetical protein